MAPRTQALVLVGVCLTPAAAYLHAPLQRSALVRANIALSPLRPPIQSALRQPPTPIVTQQRRSGAVVASAAAAPQPNFARAVTRAVLACLASMLAIVLGSARLALAAARRSSGGEFSSYVKYGVVGAVMCAGFVFRKEETPILRETPGAATLDPETLKPAEESEQAKKPPAAAASAPEPPPPLSDDPLNLDDSAMFGSLQARMQSLADERDNPAPPPEEDYTPPVDSSDSWGTGDTAVLEPPKPGDADNQPDEPKGVFDGDKSLEFPPGYPLVDGEVVEVDNTPAASADQVAMLNRMFGGLQDPE